MDSRNFPSVYHEHQVKQFCALHALNNLFGEKCFTKKTLDEICDRLCPTKGWTNPHRSFFGFGNYDVNVVMVAVQSRKCEAVWWDKRKGDTAISVAAVLAGGSFDDGRLRGLPTSLLEGPMLAYFLFCDLSTLDLKNVVGFILNLPNDYGIGSFKLPLGRRHWISIRPVTVSGSPPPPSHVSPANAETVSPREPRRAFYNLDSKFKAPLLIGNDAAVLAFLYEALESKGGEMLVVVPCLG